MEVVKSIEKDAYARECGERKAHRPAAWKGSQEQRDLCKKERGLSTVRES